MNIVIQSSCWRQEDIPTLFEDEHVKFSSCTALPSLMLELGLYKSTSEARRANRVGDVPSGWTEMKGNKKTFIWIWNPDE